MLVGTLIVGWLGSTTACSKSEEAETLPPPAPTSSAATVAVAPSTAATPSSSTSAAASATSSASVSAAGSPDASPACGDKPLPDCPLKKWMKANTAAAMASQDMDALATAFDQIAAMAPEKYTNWASISRDGAAAARAHNIDGAKGACRGCHEQYKAKYKAEMRDRPL
jgi:hypothetical protein